MMPEMDGFEFLTELRRREDWRGIPVVVVTSKDLTEEDRLRLSGYVQKVVQKGGYDRESLLVELRDLLVATTARRAHAAPVTRLPVAARSQPPSARTNSSGRSGVSSKARPERRSTSTQPSVRET